MRLQGRQRRTQFKGARQPTAGPGRWAVGTQVSLSGGAPSHAD